MLWILFIVLMIWGMELLKQFRRKEYGSIWKISSLLWEDKK